MIDWLPQPATVGRYRLGVDRYEAESLGIRVTQDLSHSNPSHSNPSHSESESLGARHSKGQRPIGSSRRPAEIAPRRPGVEPRRVTLHTQIRARAPSDTRLQPGKETDTRFQNRLRPAAAGRRSRPPAVIEIASIETSLRSQLGSPLNRGAADAAKEGSRAPPPTPPRCCCRAALPPPLNAAHATRLSAAHTDPSTRQAGPVACSSCLSESLIRVAYRGRLPELPLVSEQKPALWKAAATAPPPARAHTHTAAHTRTRTRTHR